MVTKITFFNLYNRGSVYKLLSSHKIYDKSFGMQSWGGGHLCWCYQARIWNMGPERQFQWLDSVFLDLLTSSWLCNTAMAAQVAGDTWPSDYSFCDVSLNSVVLEWPLNSAHPANLHEFKIFMLNYWFVHMEGFLFPLMNIKWLILILSHFCSCTFINNRLFANNNNKLNFELTKMEW